MEVNSGVISDWAAVDVYGKAAMLRGNRKMEKKHRTVKNFNDVNFGMSSE